MPELPEVEHLRRSLEPVLVGARVRAVDVRRADVVAPCGAAPAMLLAGDSVEALARRGKQMAIIGESGRAICVQLGMTGRLFFVAGDNGFAAPRHSHLLWTLDAPTGPGRLVFQDSRRFGGIRCFESFDRLIADKWTALGPDGLTVTARQLGPRLTATRRPVKAALLDQALVAGVGNIYADEALHRAGIHPARIAADLSADEAARLAAAIRAVLRSSVRRGGTTFRDYIDGLGREGGNQRRLRVYGRAGQPCLTCRTPLRRILLVQRTTVFCPVCQPA